MFAEQIYPTPNLPAAQFAQRTLQSNTTLLLQMYEH